MKRAFDLVVAALGLLLLAPLMAIAALLVKLDSNGPVFFTQERIGKKFRPFLIYKFRTMVHDPWGQGRRFTVGNDPRITRVGRILRKTKIDELPQLINVLKGDMALVGPRPEVPEFVELFRRDFEEILRVRPGITDLGSMKYRHEAELLGRASNPTEEYVTRILPDKIKLAKDYTQNSSFFFDLTVIFKTLLKLFDRGAA